MQVTKLYAERDDSQRKIGEGFTKTKAKAIVTKMEEAGTWPEGYDAVFVDGHGKYWFLADSWEVCGDGN